MLGLSFRPIQAVLAAGFVMMGIATAQSKVGVINIQRAVTDTAEWKKISADLAAKYKPRTDALQKAQQDLNDLQTQLQASQGKLSAAGQADLESRARRKQNEAERLNDDLQADVDRERNIVLERAQSRIEAILKKICEDQKIDVVIDLTNRVWHNPALEITDAVIAAYDKAFPVK